MKIILLGREPKTGAALDRKINFTCQGGTMVRVEVGDSVILVNTDELVAAVKGIDTLNQKRWK